MSVRSRQLALVVSVAIGLAVFLTGCLGGGGSTSTTSTSVSGTTQVSTVAAGSSVGNAVEALLETKLATTQDTPEAYVAAVGQARPVAMLFYVPGSVDDSKVLETFKTVQADFPDFTFLTYDYKNPESYGDLSLLLQVNYPPEIVLIDKAGTIRQIWNGYVDEGTLKQCLINVGQG
jgi:hypothetical protein